MTQNETDDSTAHLRRLIQGRRAEEGHGHWRHLTRRSRFAHLRRSLPSFSAIDEHHLCERGMCDQPPGCLGWSLSDWRRGKRNDRDANADTTTTSKTRSPATQHRDTKRSAFNRAYVRVRTLLVHAKTNTLRVFKDKMRMSDSQMEDASLMVQPVKAKKNVQWGTVQVVEFRVGYSPCTIPSAGGPPVGIRGRAISTAEYPLGNDPDEIEQEDLRPKADPMDVWIDPMERVRILQEENGFRLEDVALVCAEVRAIQDSRAFSYLDFDSSHALRHGDLQHLQVLRDVRYTPREQPREKIVLLEQQESTRTHLMV